MDNIGTVAATSHVDIEISDHTPNKEDDNNNITGRVVATIERCLHDDYDDDNCWRFFLTFFFNSIFDSVSLWIVS